MTNPSSVLPRSLEYQLGLMEKQIKRVAELGRLLPFPDQQQEMNELVTHLNFAAFDLRWNLPLPARSTSPETANIPFQATLDTDC